jgi:hypothetical protein
MVAGDFKHANKESVPLGMSIKEIATFGACQGDIGVFAAGNASVLHAGRMARSEIL